jgi:hypothetical protein
MSPEINVYSRKWVFHRFVVDMSIRTCVPSIGSTAAKPIIDRMAFYLAITIDMALQLAISHSICKCKSHQSDRVLEIVHANCV